MGNIYANGKNVSCDFCGTGTEDLKRLKRDPSKGRGQRDGNVVSRLICGNCRDRARKHDPDGWNRRLESGRYSLEPV